MGHCEICGKSEEIVKLYDAISNEGIVRICKRCAYENDFPIIYPPEELITEKEKESKSIKELFKDKELEKQEKQLKKIVEQNILEKIQEKKQDDPNLIKNFHWYIQRARRRRHLTIEQMSKGIHEPELLLKKIEAGFIPEDNTYKVIRKIQDFLGIQLLTKEAEERIKEELKKNPIEFDRRTPQTITMKELREALEKLKRKEKSISQETEESEETKEEEGYVEEIEFEEDSLEI